MSYSTELINKMMKMGLPVVLVPTSTDDVNTKEITEITANKKVEMDPTHPIGNSNFDKYIIIFNNDIDDTDDKVSNLNNIPGFKSKHVMKGVFKGCTATLNKGLIKQLMDDHEILVMEKDTLLYSNCYSKEPILDNSVKDKAVAYWHQTITGTPQGITDNFSNIHCYILDTGILPNHVEFGLGQVFLDYNAIQKNNLANDDNGHGTGVATVLAGNTVGVATKTILHSIKVLNSSGSGYISDIIAGINWVMTNKKLPCVINMSLGGSVSTSLNTAVQNCLNSGIQIVCASGNSGIDAGGVSPANTNGAISVSAYDSLKTKPTWSNYGSVISTFAPGVSVKSGWGDSPDSYFLVDGTSFSCPIVSGIIVRYLKEYPNSTPSQIKSFLERANISNEILKPGSTSTKNLRLVWNPLKINPC